LKLSSALSRLFRHRASGHLDDQARIFIATGVYPRPAFGNQMETIRLLSLLKAGPDTLNMDMKESLSLRTVYPELAPFFCGVLRDRTATTALNRGGPAELAEALIEDATRLGASDIHIEPHSEGARVRIRLDGALRDICHLETDTGKMLVNQFKALANLDPIVRFTPRDAHARFQSSTGQLDLRLALAPVLDRDALSIRLLDPRRLQRSITEIGLTEANLRLVTEWLKDINGMFIAAGPTGSGKSTTLYALLHSLKLSDKVILSLEDPLEYQVDGISQIQIDALHDFQFADAIKAVLRHDPDYLMVGEIRDAESAHTAISAAIAGRALLSTMHSRDCVGAITALRNWGLRDHEIAESLFVVVAQRLVRKLCLDCCERHAPSAAQAAWFQSLGLECPSRLWESKGCAKCHQLGFKGRTGVFEFWRLDENDYQMIIRHSDEHRLRAWLEEKGHRFLITGGFDLLDQGVTTFEELRRVAAGTLNTPPRLEGLNTH
jgi:general secretion pathway protein E